MTFEEKENDDRSSTLSLLTSHMHYSIVLEDNLEFYNCHCSTVCCRNAPVCFHRSRISNSTVHRDIPSFDNHLGFVRLHNVQEWHHNYRRKNSTFFRSFFRLFTIRIENSIDPLDNRRENMVRNNLPDLQWTNRLEKSLPEKKRTFPCDIQSHGLYRGNYGDETNETEHGWCFESERNFLENQYSSLSSVAQVDLSLYVDWWLTIEIALIRPWRQTQIVVFILVAIHWSHENNHTRLKATIESFILWWYFKSSAVDNDELLDPKEAILEPDRIQQDLDPRINILPSYEARVLNDSCASIDFAIRRVVGHWIASV